MDTFSFVLMMCFMGINDTEPRCLKWPPYPSYALCVQSGIEKLSQDYENFKDPEYTKKYKVVGMSCRIVQGKES